MEITEIMTKGADYKWVYLIATHPPLPKVTFVICLLLFHVSLLPNTAKGSGMQMIDVTGVRLRVKGLVIHKHTLKEVCS